jgi:hypothetical protein
MKKPVENPIVKD